MGTSELSKIGSGIMGFLKKIFGAAKVAVNDLHAASGALQLALPPLVFALQQAGLSGASQEVTNVSNEVITDSGMLSQLLTQAQSGNGTAASQAIGILTNIKNQVPTILTDVHVKNSDLRSTIQNAYNGFLAEASVVVGLLPSVATPAPPQGASPNGMTGTEG